VGGSGSPTLGPNLAGQLDAFTSAVDAFVPPAMWLQALSKADTATVTSGSDRVRQQIRPLAGAALGELDALLRERQDRLSIRQTWTMLGGGAGVLLLGALLSLLLPAPPRATPTSTGADERDESATQGFRQTGFEDSRFGDRGFAGMGFEGTGFAENGLVDPPDPDAAEELLHVGRAVRAHRRERVGDVR
jgi:hypothetical protein